MSKVPEIDSIYQLNGRLFKCIKPRPTGVHTFQMIDEAHNPLRRYKTNAPAIVEDWGIRIITNNFSQMKLINGSK